jgi:hypothetical protein
MEFEQNKPDRDANSNDNRVIVENNADRSKGFSVDGGALARSLLNSRLNNNESGVNFSPIRFLNSKY